MESASGCVAPVGSCRHGELVNKRHNRVTYIIAKELSKNLEVYECTVFLSVAVREGLVKKNLIRKAL